MIIKCHTIPPRQNTIIICLNHMAHFVKPNDIVLVLIYGIPIPNTRPQNV